jgi:hypothetical protein
MSPLNRDSKNPNIFTVSCVAGMPTVEISSQEYCDYILCEMEQK